MISRVSFIVPTRNAGRTLRACLVSIREQDYPDVELIVVDNASDDASLAIAREFADIVDMHGPERCAQRNRGANFASGDVLVFADADMVFEPGVAREVVAQLHDPCVGAVVIPELAFGAGFWARCRVLEKELYVGDSAVEAARGFRTRDFFEVGGYDERFVGGEDWELADRVVGNARALGRTDARIWHDEGRIALREQFTKKRYYGRGLATYFETTRARPIGRRALREPRRLARRPHLTAGLAVLKTVELSGAAVGLLGARRSEAR